MHNRYALLPTLKRNALTITGLTIVIGLVVCAIFAPQIAPYDPFRISPVERLQPPSWAHLCGTDSLGRDIFSRILYGARISLSLGVTVVFFTSVIGSVVGVVSGYVGGLFDEIVMRVTDVFMSVPYLVLAVLIAAVLGPSLENTMISQIITWWPMYARLIRGQVLLVREATYIEAAVGVGAGRARILATHVIPNTLSPIIIQASLSFGNVIMYAAGLSFIGVGAQPPSPEWGAMISDGRSFLQEAWWYPTFPGLVILLTVIGFNLLGDAIRDYLDPRFGTK